MVRRAAAIAADRGYAASGYRTVFNCNAGAGQTVFHLHLHALGGRAMTWPPGRPENLNHRTAEPGTRNVEPGTRTRNQVRI